jgi:hypothetical protein
MSGLKSSATPTSANIAADPMRTKGEGDRAPERCHAEMLGAAGEHQPLPAPHGAYPASVPSGGAGSRRALRSSDDSSPPTSSQMLRRNVSRMNSHPTMVVISATMIG